MKRWALALLLLGACASAHRQSAVQPAAAPPGQTMPAGGDPRSQIEQLSQQIDAQRQQMALAPSAHATSMSSAPIAPLSTEDATCKPAPTQTCTDSCRLSDSICDSAKKICDLAKGMPGDAWADGKCNDAKQTCSDAHTKCCGCQ